MEYPQNFILKECSMECSQCRTVFAMRVLADLPPVTLLDKIEADLHRVLPHPALRGALIAVCPDCGYADWTTKFVRSIVSPLIAVPTPDIDHCRKFAMAVKWARQLKLQPLDIAYIALNGLYCAREAGQEDEAWLELCVYEQTRGLESEDLAIETAQDHLVMAELWRQLGCFDKALAEYDKARGDESVPEELLRHQISVARACDRQPTILPPGIVRILYPDAIELTAIGAVTPESFQKPVVQQCNPLFMMDTDEATGLFKPVPKEQRPAWAANARFDVDVEAEFELDEELQAQLAEVERAVREGRSLAPKQTAEPMQTFQPAAMAALQAAAAAQVEQSVQAAKAESVKATDSAQAEEPAKAAAPVRIEQAVQTSQPASLVESDATEQPVQITEPAKALQPIQASQPHTAEPIPVAASVPVQQSFEAVPLSLVKQVMAVPEAASTVSLVHSTNSSGTAAIISTHGGSAAGNATAYGASPASAKETNTEPKQSISPGPVANGKQGDDRAHKALNRALKVVGPGNDLNDRLPNVQICDEDQPPPPPNDRSQAQKPAQPAANNKNPQEAIAQVESFLSLTRQPGYQNWIRGYRR